MPPLRLTDGIIAKACELRAYGGSDGACARHARVTPQTFSRWLHFGQALRDYLNNGDFESPEYYRTWTKEARVIIEKLKRELEETSGTLSHEHRRYLKLWDGMLRATDAFVVECQQTIDKAKNADPSWALRGLRWFHPDEYREPAEVAAAQAQENTREELAATMLALPANVLAPRFLDAYDDIGIHGHTEYVFRGGRGSTKSSFISLVIVWLIKNNPTMHAIALRQVGNTLRDSVYSQLEWAINELGLADQFKCTVSPLEITYLTTGQKIYFRGADEPGKIKSIKPAFGYIGIAWFEELDQFRGPEAVRNIEQSAIRGGDLAYIFKSFNPPRTAANWANKYVQIPKENQYQHHSTYLEMGSRIRWLGKSWVDEAEHLKAVNPKAYEHEYLGIANGTGGQVFENIQLRTITDEEVAQFDHVLHGLDWGYYPDPAHYARCHYDAARLTLYVHGELRRYKTSNRQFYDDLVSCGLTPEDTIIADSAEPKSVADFREYGASCRGAEKGPESVKYSMKWLQSLTAIVIDPERCPETAQEFLDYELEQDKDGNFISEYPDKDNHAIDAVRYATNLIWRRRGQ